MKIKRVRTLTLNVYEASDITENIKHISELTYNFTATESSLDCKENFTELVVKTTFDVTRFGWRVHTNFRSSFKVSAFMFIRIMCDRFFIFWIYGRASSLRFAFR